MLTEVREMELTLYQKVKNLCDQRGIPIYKLESTLGFGNASIKKWGVSSSPSVDKIMKVANYFGVSVDYLLGNSEVAKPISEVIEDEDIISLQRAREKMTPEDRKRMMQMLKLGFEYAFREDDADK